ncbi:MAG: c-type cytochrome [Gemmatimonadetes bacterium]|uniref:C-type cytochrome n=1 Tax=Candidatus Kutchimonas denitrificans TaxID=3056748 RepID=A0AAE4ZD21_9BACT|nr:c-type cytochrome [Gemmatimonadota bacterium]NIR75790.1 c-type cytochrome [Candidatus Kutchimonas denitrificans]NIS01958.1 c-type cytochrome [Gemmatimonadota bacterium]NIT67762.1 c-type cytochrome [Gemmatimonadota bacterium]NIU53749.1 c-type cytochrome [Gemmatimonadota bacterium]
MSDKTARWIFYVGTLVSLVLFVGLTVDTHRQVATLTHADRLDEQVVAGKRVWHRYNCNDCHTILGFGSYYAPDLTHVHWRRGGDGIKAVVRTPEKYTTWRHMPHLAVSEQELDDLVAFLAWTAEIDTNQWPPQDEKFRSGAGRAVSLGVSAGANLFREKGCFACHTLEGTGGSAGPDLTDVGSRLNEETIRSILADPQAVDPEATMPRPPLTERERDELASFLATRSS